MTNSCHEKPYGEWTDDQLKVEAKSLYHLIYVEDCFSKGDLVRLELVARELERRNIEAVTDLAFN